MLVVLFKKWSWRQCNGWNSFFGMSATTLWKKHACNAHIFLNVIYKQHCLLLLLLSTLLIFNVSHFIQKANMKTMQWLKLIVWNENNNIVKWKNTLATRAFFLNAICKQHHLLLLLTLLIFNVSCFVQKVIMKTVQWLKLIFWNEHNNIMKQKNTLAMHMFFKWHFQMTSFVTN